MVNLTRHDCILGSAAQMRAAVVQVVHHVAQRRAFGSALLDKPLMQNVVADLLLESEAAVALGMRIARALDEKDDAFARVANVVGKFWVCKRAPGMVNEAQECLGGLGYVEDSPLPRLYRQAPLNSIWEGSGNVQCVDLLRALRHAGGSAEAALRRELGACRGFDPRLDGAAARALAGIAHLRAQDPADAEYLSRGVMAHLAVALQAAVLAKGDAAVARAFVAARLGGGGGAAAGLVYGCLPKEVACRPIIDRALCLPASATPQPPPAGTCAPPARL